MNLISKEINLTMSSREIADLTGKRHDNVLADIRKMLVEINSPEKLGQYKDSTGRTLPVLLLNKEESLCLVTGYSIKLRMTIIKRWQELEEQLKAQHHQQIPQTYAEALQLAADQARQLELAAPKVAFVDNLVDRGTLMTSTQVAQKHKKSAVWLNKFLDEVGVFNRSVKRSRAFQQWFIDKGFGEMKQTELGYSQSLFTTAGEVWINEKLVTEGAI